MAVVVDGGYFEASADGVYWCEPGMVIMHPALHAHANRFLRSRSCVVNLPCTPRMLGIAQGCSVLRVAHVPPKALSRLALPDVLAVLREATLVPPLQTVPLARRAAALLDQGPATSVTTLARLLGISREHLAREFRRWFGLSPTAYRAERRLRRAVGILVAGRGPLSRVAQDAGFTDHAHLTRTISAATGMPPSVLRYWLES